MTEPSAMNRFRSSAANAIRHPAGLMAALYALVMGAACHVQYAVYGYGDFDLAVHTQSLESILKGSLYSPILGVPFLGNHLVWILYPLAPLYACCRSPLLLLYTQVLVLAAGGPAVYRIAAMHLRRPWPAWLTAVYYLYPPLLLMTLYEFHPIALASTFLLWMLWAYQARRFRWFLAFLALALACQENVSLLAAGMGVYALLDRRRGRWAVVPLAIGIVYFVAAAGWLLPRLNPHIQFIRLYARFGDSLPDVLWHLATHPLQAARFMFTAEKRAFLAAIFAPTAFLGLLAPLALVPLLPVAAQRLLSARPSEASIAYHYQAEFIPFVFYSAVFGLRRLLRTQWRPAALLAGIALVLLPILGLIGSGAARQVTQTLRVTDEERRAVRLNDAMLEQVPPRAAVLATFDYLPRLTARTTAYSLHHVYQGRYTLSDDPYPTPTVDWVAMNVHDPLSFGSHGFYGPRHYRGLQTLLETGNWSVAFMRDGRLLLTASDGRAAEPVVEWPPTGPVDAIPMMSRDVDQDPSAPLRLVGFRLLPDAEATAQLTLYWSRLSPAVFDADAQLELAGPEIVYRGRLAPGHRIWPPQSWPAGRLVADRHRITLARQPADLGTVRASVSLIPLHLPPPPTTESNPGDQP